jgi:hypothetical protein
MTNNNSSSNNNNKIRPLSNQIIQVSLKKTCSSFTSTLTTSLIISKQDYCIMNFIMHSSSSCSSSKPCTTGSIDDNINNSTRGDDEFLSLFTTPSSLAALEPTPIAPGGIRQGQIVNKLGMYRDSASIKKQQQQPCRSRQVRVEASATRGALQEKQNWQYRLALSTGVRPTILLQQHQQGNHLPSSSSPAFLTDTSERSSSAMSTSYTSSSTTTTTNSTSTTMVGPPKDVDLEQLSIYSDIFSNSGCALTQRDDGGKFGVSSILPTTSSSSSSCSAAAVAAAAANAAIVAKKKTGLQKKQQHHKIRRSRKYNTAQWDERFEELLQFREEHGHLLVPHAYPLNPKLAQWVKR